ncbi:MAG: hypothetical protein ACI843_002934 [Psychrobacter glaciei]|jgi:hypothetical protein
MSVGKIQKIVILVLGLMAFGSGVYHLVLMEDASYSGGVGKDFSIFYTLFPVQYNGVVNIIAGLILLLVFFFVDFDKRK